MAAKLVLLLFFSLASGGPLPPFHLKCQDNLVGLSGDNLLKLSKQYLFATDEPQPRFSWSLKHTDRSAKQSAFQVLVSQSHGFNEIIWDSGKLSDSYNTSVRYSGPKLSSGLLYFWKIRWWDHNDKVSESEEIGHFLTGSLDPSDWDNIPWIVAPAEVTTAPLFSKNITIDSSSVKQATLFVSGLGFNKPLLNDIDLNAQFDPPIALSPGWTNYEKRVPYTVYHVTDDVRSSDSLKVEVTLGVGWRNRTDYMNKDTPSSIAPRVLRLRLMVLFTNNSYMDALASDASWDVTTTPIVHDNIYDGELYDSRSSAKQATGKASVTQGPAGIMYLAEIPPIVEIETVKPIMISMRKNSSGGLVSHIVDFGNNSAGYCRINVKGLKNVSLHHAEVLMHPPYGTQDGSLYYGNLRGAEQLDTILTDGELEYYKPTFTYHGFRYVEVTGFEKLAVDQIEKIVVRTNVALNGKVNTSSKVLNTIQAGAVNSQLSNMMSVPTDCNQRDERLGWMGDAGLSAESMMNNFDTKAFHENYLLLIADEFANALPDVVPYYRYGGMPSDPAWGDAYVEILHLLFEKYKDVELMDLHYDYVTLYILKLVDAIPPSGMGELRSSYGDWVPPPEFKKVNGSFVSSFVLLKGLQRVREFAQFKAEEDTVKLFDQLLSDLLKQFNETFENQNSNGTYLMESQASYVLPLALGLWGPNDNLTKNFMMKFKADKSHITTGIIGARHIFNALLLTSQGKNLALQLAEQVDYPSWGFMYFNQEEPATGMWELWNSLNGSAGMDSRNHHMFSSVSSYIKTQATGVSQPKGSYGFDMIHFRPAETLGLSYAEVSFDFPKQVAFSWQRNGGTQCAKVPEDHSPLSPNLIQNGGLDLNCGDESFIGEISFASFGNPTGQCDYGYKINDCHAPNSKKVVEKLCIGESACNVPTGVDYWGDPCPMKSKWLSVKAICYSRQTKEPDYKYSSIVAQASVPVGSRASLFLPAHGKENFTVWENNNLIFTTNGKNGLGKSVGITYSQWDFETDSLILNLDSGDYNFIARGTNPRVHNVRAINDGIVLKCNDGMVIGSVDEIACSPDGIPGCVGKSSCKLHSKDCDKASISYSCVHR